MYKLVLLITIIGLSHSWDATYCTDDKTFTAILADMTAAGCGTEEAAVVACSTTGNAAWK